MKIVVLIFACLLGFGFAGQEAVSVKEPEKAVANVMEIEVPVMDIVLDTVEITVSSSRAVAGI